MRGNRDANWLFNGRMSPVVPYAIRGAIWNQGWHNRNQGIKIRLIHERARRVVRIGDHNHFCFIGDKFGKFIWLWDEAIFWACF